MPIIRVGIEPAAGPAVDTHSDPDRGVQVPNTGQIEARQKIENMPKSKC